MKSKENECKLMSSELLAVKEQKSKVEDILKKQKASTLSTFEDAMESELQCSICSELFIEVKCNYCFECLKF